MSFNICFTFALSKSGTNLILFKMSIESKAKPILHSSPAGTGCSTRPLNSMSDKFLLLFSSNNCLMFEPVTDLTSCSTYCSNFLGATLFDFRIISTKLTNLFLIIKAACCVDGKGNDSKRGMVRGVVLAFLTKF